MKRRYRNVWASIGNTAQVEPNSGLMLAMVTRSATLVRVTPGP